MSYGDVNKERHLGISDNYPKDKLRIAKEALEHAEMQNLCKRSRIEN